MFSVKDFTFNDLRKDKFEVIQTPEHSAQAFELIISLSLFLSSYFILLFPH